MLSRTADNLFWLSRYVERADYLARILETTSRLSVLPAAYAGDMGFLTLWRRQNARINDAAKSIELY